MRDAFLNLKKRAKARGKPFDLTIEQFTELCEKSGYVTGKKNTATGLTIDRKDNSIGYTISNLQVITRRENNIKQNRIDYAKEKREAAEVAGGSPF